MVAFEQATIEQAGVIVSNGVIHIVDARCRQLKESSGPERTALGSHRAVSIALTVRVSNLARVHEASSPEPKGMDGNIRADDLVTSVPHIRFVVGRRRGIRGDIFNLRRYLEESLANLTPQASHGADRHHGNQTEQEAIFKKGCTLRRGGFAPEEKLRSIFFWHLRTPDFTPAKGRCQDYKSEIPALFSPVTRPH